MMKKTLSILLALMMLLCLLPMNAFAEDVGENANSDDLASTGANTVISEVYITADAQPVKGANPNYLDIVPKSEQSKYTYGGSTWRNMTDNTVLGSSYTFRDDKIYSLELTLNAKDGYEFDHQEDNIGAHILGVSTLPNFVVQNTGVKEYYHKRIIVYYIFRMNVSDQTSCIIKFYPNGGFGYKKPVAVPFNEGYDLPANEPTTNGFTAPYGGTFDKWKYNYASGAPGKRIKVTQDLNMKAQWTMSPMVDTVSISGLASPRWKTTPDYTVTYTGSNYQIYTGYDDATYIKNGIEWREYNHTRVPYNRSFSNSDTQFYVTIYLKATGDYIFNEPDQMTALVNGRKANVELDNKADDPNSGKYIKVTFGYLSMTSSVNVTIPEPVAYQKLSLTADVRGEAKQNTSRNTSSYHNGICWTDETNYPGVILPADTIALPGHKYQAVVSIIPKNNYEFPVDNNLHTFLPEAVCNGETIYQNAGYGDYTGDGIRGEDECYVYHRFSTPVVDTYTVLNQAGVSVTAPTVGQSPVYQATASGTGYTVKRIEWLNTATGATVTTAQKFEAGGKYTVRVTLAADDGYRFAYSGTSYTTSVYVNGIKGYSDPFTNVFEITACYDYAALPGSNYTLSGSFTSYLGNTEPLTLELYKDGQPGIKKTLYTATGTYEFKTIPAGKYTLRVSKTNHVTRDYEITVSGNTTQDVKIHPKGDISGDGKVTTKDFGMAYAHAQKLAGCELTGYQLKCCDVVKNDGKITTTDAARINAHVQKTDLLW